MNMIKFEDITSTFLCNDFEEKYPDSFQELKIVYDEYVNHYNEIKNLTVEFSVDDIKTVWFAKNRKDWWNTFIKLNNVVDKWNKENNFELEKCKNTKFKFDYIEFAIAEPWTMKTNKIDFDYGFSLLIGLDNNETWTSVIRRVMKTYPASSGSDREFAEDNKDYKKYLNKCRRYLKLNWD